MMNMKRETRGMGPLARGRATATLARTVAVAAMSLLTACGGGGGDGSPVTAIPGTPSPAPGTLPVAACQPVPQSLTSIFEAEGPSPYSADGCSMVFDALAAQVVTPNGNGWRHELKIPSRLRTGMTRITESFTADIKVDLSRGGKTIVLQYHAEGTGTIVKVYVADSSESGFFNSIADDGIFDVYVRVLPAGSTSEEKLALGTITSGETFHLSVSNVLGHVSVSAFGNTKVATVADGGASYLKFGNYLQSQDPVSGVNCTPFATCYASFGIVEATVTMSQVAYSRQ